MISRTKLQSEALKEDELSKKLELKFIGTQGQANYFLFVRLFVGLFFSFSFLLPVPVRVFVAIIHFTDAPVYG